MGQVIWMEGSAMSGRNVNSRLRGAIPGIGSVLCFYCAFRSSVQRGGMIGVRGLSALQFPARKPNQLVLAHYFC